MDSFTEIVKAWGRAEMADDLSTPSERVPEERVRGWERFDNIPDKHWQELLKRAPERNICISADLLVNLAARD